MDKKGIELSVNFLVVVIISLVILSSGIVLLYKFIGEAEELKLMLDEQTEEQLHHLLIDGGQQVVLSKHTLKVKGEGRGILGIGILNTGETADFKIDFVQNEIERRSSDKHWLLWNNAPIRIEEHGFHTEPILITIPLGVERGDYVFDVLVWKNDGAGDIENDGAADIAYGGIKKMYVIVE